ncbi:MAG: arylesterase [Bryobacteraceae bacterium]
MSGLLSSAMTGCGDKEPTRQAEVNRDVPASTKNSAPKEKEPLIIAFGDSLTAGVAGKSYPDYLQDMLREHGYNYVVENQGVSGDTTSDGLARIENVVVEKPALVILEFGGNDGLRGLPVESIRKNLEEMISRIQEAKIPLALLGITLPPNYGPEYVKPFTYMFPQLAKQYKIPALPFLLSHVYQDPKLMQPDGIHPNSDGNRIVAQDVFQLISKLLKPAQK